MLKVEKMNKTKFSFLLKTIQVTYNENYYISVLPVSIQRLNFDQKLIEPIL